MNRLVSSVSLMALLLAGCRDVVTSRYETRAEAEADRLFERGWLPSIIPPSSRGIVTRNDPDLNRSEGEFRFDRNEKTAFLQHLRRAPEEDHASGEAWRYENWLFRISEEGETVHCRYALGAEGRP